MIWGVVIGSAIVLAVAGVAKLAKPDVTTEAIRAAGLPASRWATSLLGLAELTVGVIVAVWHPVVGATIVGVFYVSFAAFSVRLLTRRDANTSCGCFGQRDAPIGLEHVIVNVIMALVAFDAAAGIGPHTVDPVAAVGTASVLVVLLAVVPGLRASRI